MNSLWKRGVAAGVLATWVAAASAAPPCDGVDRSLSAEHQAAWAPEIARQLEVKRVEVLQSFRYGGWSIIYVETFVSDEQFLFYAHDPLTSHYVTSWSGAAATFEEDEIGKWVLQNAPKIPLTLAKCFAWHVTNDRDK